MPRVTPPRPKERARRIGAPAFNSCVAAIAMPPLAAAKDTNRTVFKARPVNKKVLESVGDLGVPRVLKKAPTTVKEFSFASRAPARKTQVDPVANSMSRPLYSSFAKPTPRTATPRGPAPSKTAATLKTKPKPTPAAIEAEAPEAVAPAAVAPVEEAPAAVSEAPTKAQPTVEELGATLEDLAAMAAAEAEWVMVAEAKRVPMGKRRVWAKDALPAYMASAEEEEDEADGDYEPTKAGGKGVSRARVWGVDQLPQYMETKEEEEEDDADYAPTPKAQKKARVEVPTIADPSMAEYVELS